jgi:hypothetical protein
LAIDKWVQKEFVGGVGLPGMRLGRNVNHDPLNYFFQRKVTLAQPQDVRHKLYIPPLDQGDTGSCTGNAETHCLATDKFWTALSASQQASLNESTARSIYSLATQLDSYPGQWPPTDTGSDGTSVNKAATQLGYANGYEHAMGLTNILLAMVDRAGITGLVWLNSMFNTASDGHLIVDKASGTAGGHEICVFGVDVANRRVWFRNSWGPNWGGDGTSELAGCFYLTWDEYDWLLQQDGDFTQPVPLSAPAPTPTPPSPGGLLTPTDADRALRLVGHKWAHHTHTPIAENSTMKHAYLAWEGQYNWGATAGF